ncbi:ATP-binding cassette domain-containing protein [Sulfidibacter corallicola]|nr:ATP-binding cassette domain-containing protein [Sulfidibacter corallicola]
MLHGGALSARFLIPERIQNSDMDSGPTALKCLMEGLGVEASLDELRRLCRTAVDGTDASAIGHLACRFGVQVREEIVPAELLFQDRHSTRPSIIKTSRMRGSNHFCVVWNQLGSRLQVLDTRRGRCWPKRRRFLEEAEEIRRKIDEVDWRQWAGETSFLDRLDRVLDRLGIAVDTRETLIAAALADTSWFGLAALEAATRLTMALVDSGGLDRGSEAEHALQRLVHRVVETPGRVDAVIPERYWSVVPTNPDAEGHDQLEQRGVLVLSVEGLGRPNPVTGSSPRPIRRARLPHPMTYLLHLMLQDGLVMPLFYLLALAVMASGTMIEALLFRSLLDMGATLNANQRLSGILIILLFLVSQLALQFLITQARLRIGGKIEARLRMAFLQKLPRLSRAYLSTLSLGDISERCHSVTDIRQISSVVSRIINNTFGLILTTAGLIWLDPRVAVLAIVGTTLFLALPLFLAPLLASPDMRHRTHGGSLTTYYLDSLKGLVACRTHGAERSVSRAHDCLLVEWTLSGRALQVRAVWIEGLTTLAGFSLAAALIIVHLQAAQQLGSVLLFAFWALRIPIVGETLISGVQSYPGIRNRTLRLMEAIFASDDSQITTGKDTLYSLGRQAVTDPNRGIEIDMRQVSVKASGQTILKDIDLRIRVGEHVAIVGPSGAGKSTLAGLLLGTHRPNQGEIRIDGSRLDFEKLEWLRAKTTWVSPAVNLWNRSLLANIQYGAEPEVRRSMAELFSSAMLYDVIESLPRGLQSELGEEGTFLSGGQGTRVRLGRGLMRPGAQLIILDEPFRGLDRAARRDLLQTVRHWWPEATILFITHDVREAMLFDRVVVVEDGTISEDDHPKNLKAKTTSHFNRLLEAEQRLTSDLWQGPNWRRVHMSKGRFGAEGAEDSP